MSWEFTNNLNWDLVHRNTYSAQPATADGEQFIPIPAITVPVDSNILIIGARNSFAKPSWYLAGSVSARLLFSPSYVSQFTASVEASRKKLQLNKLNLIRFSDYDITNYSLEINISKWHKQMFIEIWKYSGTMGDVETTVEQVKDTTERIEYKIDASAQ